MTAQRYHTAVRRAWLFNTVALVGTFIVSIAAPVGVLFLTDQATVDRFFEALRNRGPDGEPRTGFLFMAFSLAVIGVPTALGLLAFLWTDRRFGIRCPLCSQSLTARDLPSRRVLLTGRCWRCDGVLFDVDQAFLERLRHARRPAVLVRTYVVIGVLGLAMFHVLPFDEIRSGGLGFSLFCSWLASGLGLYSSIRYPTREVRLMTAAAVLVAVWSAALFWEAGLHGIR